MQKPIIKVENLTVGYDDEIILSDISFEVPTGQVFVILGGSGCGKSTLLKNIIGLHEPMAGNVYIKDVNFTTSNITQRQEMLKKIGVAYQSGAIFGSMTVGENIELVLEEFTAFTPIARKTISQMKLKLVGLEDAADKMPSELSGGMQKRAAIARAMALEPEIIFLDEPSAGLDPVTSASLDELVIHLSKELGITFVVVTHELSSIFSIADNTIMLDKDAGAIIATGRPDDLKANSPDPRVKQFFNRQPNKSGII